MIFYYFIIVENMYNTAKLKYLLFCWSYNFDSLRLWWKFVNKKENKHYEAIETPVRKLIGFLVRLIYWVIEVKWGQILLCIKLHKTCGNLQGTLKTPWLLKKVMRSFLSTLQLIIKICSFIHLSHLEVLFRTLNNAHITVRYLTHDHTLSYDSK